MNHNSASQTDVNTTEDNAQGPMTRRYKKPIVAMTMAVVGALALSPLADGASASTAVRQASSSPKLAVTQLVPPTGMVWVQGRLTDQAGHGLDNVNVEVWSSDPGATAPIGSNLTYGGFPQDGRHGHGAYRVEVPLGQPYRIEFSGVGGVEDGDAYRQTSYGQGRPIMFRASGAKGATAAKAGTVRNLGTTELVHQGKVRSTVRAARPARVKAGNKGTLNLRVTSPFVAPVIGKVVVKVAGRKLTRSLNRTGNGKTTIRLPKLTTGKHKISVYYVGSGTVQRSAARQVTVTVMKKK